MKLNRKNLYVRFGTTEHEEIITERPLSRVNLPDGTQMVIGGKHSSTAFSDNISFNTRLVLKTFLGYIPLENIRSRIDLLRLRNYVTDDLEWIQEYGEDARLRWGSIADEELIKSREQILCKKRGA